MSCVTKAQVLEALSMLAEVYHRPRRWTSLDSVAERWLEVLADVEPDELAAGVQDQIRTSDDFMPKPGRIRELALKHRHGGAVFSALEERYRRWTAEGYRNAEGRETPCPVCGASPEWRPRYTVVNIYASHVRQGVPIFGDHDGRMPPAHVAAPPVVEGVA